MIQKLTARSTRVSPLGATGGVWFQDADSPFSGSTVVFDIPGGARCVLLIPDTEYAKSLVTGAFRTDDITPDEAGGYLADGRMLASPGARPAEDDVAGPPAAPPATGPDLAAGPSDQTLL